MNFSIEDLINRIEQLEKNSVNNANVYELTKTIDALVKRLDSVEVIAKRAASSEVFAPIINNMRGDFKKIKERVSGLSDAIDPITNLEKVVDSARRTYGEELSSFTLKTNKKLDEINKALGVNNGE